MVALCIRQAQVNGISLAGIGVAATGWPDPNTGVIVEATDGIKGWKGTHLGPYLAKGSGLKVSVENDANALAVAEKTFGLAKDVDNFAVITLGTGVGGGCYVNNRLMRGSHMVANAIGHITVVPGGLPCQCGLLGCVESYVSAAALVRSVNLAGIFTAQDVITRASEGDPLARSAIEVLAGHLAAGCAAVVNLLDPEMIVLAGGLVQNNLLLIEYLEKHLAERLAAGRRGQTKIYLSQLGYFAGVIGAAACAIRPA